MWVTAASRQKHLVETDLKTYCQIFIHNIIWKGLETVLGYKIPQFNTINVSAHSHQAFKFIYK